MLVPRFRDLSGVEFGTAAHWMKVAAGIRIALFAALSSLAAAQSRAPVSAIEVQGRTYLAQTGAERELLLTPNTCFFDGSGLRAQGDGPEDLPHPELNKGQSFASLTGFTHTNRAVWFVHIACPGRARLLLDADPAVFQWECAGRSGELDSGGVQELEFEEAGVHRLRIGTRSLSNEANEAGRTLRGVKLEGPALAGASVLRARWRPKAAHAKFHSETLQGDSRLWVMELDARPGAAKYYSPLTTPFGYFGSSWTPEGRPTGMNFSMWSYGRGEDEPSIEKLSHLIAIGHPEASFSGFGHEGTGVKVRDWNPFEGWEGQRAVYAVRLEPGTDYDTFHGYYFDEERMAWRLFASGKKRVRKRPLANLTAGSFVEVPGPPARQRTGHLERTMRYRGYALDAEGRWHAFSRMKGEGKPGELCNRRRGSDGNGRFVLSMGGMEQFGPNPEVHIEVDPTLPKWLDASATAPLFTTPTEVTLLSLERRGSKRKLRYHVRGAGEKATATLYYGKEEGLTFAERWENALPVGEVEEGESSFDWAAEEGVVRVRLLVENDQGRYWSTETMLAQD